MARFEQKRKFAVVLKLDGEISNITVYLSTRAGYILLRLMNMLVALLKKKINYLHCGSFLTFSIV